MSKKKSIFDLFPGIAIYDTENVVVKNRFSGEPAELTPEEVAVYDVLKGAEMLGAYNTVRKGLDWFRSNNAKAYMVLLD